MLGTALIVSIVSAWHDRQELQKVTEANDFLRKSLGDMTKALTSKDNEIDELEGRCPPEAPETRKGTRMQ